MYPVRCNPVRWSFLGAKIINAKRSFGEKDSIAHAQLGSKYASGIKHQIPPISYRSGILICPRTMDVICSH